jgi:hypothetical protein
LCDMANWSSQSPKMLTTAPGNSAYSPAAKAGQYGVRWSVKAEPDPSCDPTQQECEQWLPGTYVVDVAVCNGECGSKHPHSAIYDQARTNFTLN